MEELEQPQKAMLFLYALELLHLDQVLQRTSSESLYNWEKMLSTVSLRDNCHNFLQIAIRPIERKSFHFTRF